MAEKLFVLWQKFYQSMTDKKEKFKISNFLILIYFCFYYSQIQDGLEMIADHINEPKFSEKDFEAAKQDVLVCFLKKTNNNLFFFLIYKNFSNFL